MRIPFLKSVTLLALTAFSALALADVPARVGRISLAQGQVNIGGEVGEEVNTALVNWPVTSRNQLSTARGARTEFRIGSTAVRLDSDSAMDIVELDDDSLRLHLHYGSASIRVRSEDVARGFELSTPQGRIRIKEPGRLRIDAERNADTTVVNVFDGAALVDDGGSTLTVRAGKRVELHNEDVRTGLAVRDAFDDWALLRDQHDDRVTSDRYVTTDMTGYEELDRNGVWRDDNEYGPLWTPSRVPANWAPYRDGRWTYLAPWGWTWVDNAPWGYAPFHYGRWIVINQRWCWAPGRNVGRPVWAPALVGWVGGSNWSLSFSSSGHRPAQGWYPLAPRDSFVPGYRVSQDHLRYINRNARNDNDRRALQQRRDGLTVVPHEQFGHRGQIVVPNAPRAVVPALALQSAPLAPPPAPVSVTRDRDIEGRRLGRFGNDNQPGALPRYQRDGDNRDNRDNRDRDNRDNRGNGRFERDRQGVVQVAPAAVPVPAASPVPFQQQRAPVAVPQPGTNAPVPTSRREGRLGDDERRVRMPPMVPVERPAPVVPPAPVVAPAPVAAPQPVPVPVPMQAAPQPQPAQRARDERQDGFNRRADFERQDGANRRADFERERRQRELQQQQQQQQQHQPQPQQQHQPQPRPQQQHFQPPPMRQAPPPQAMPQPQPAPQAAPPAAPVARPAPQQQPAAAPPQQQQGERGRRNEGRERRQDGGGGEMR